MQSDHGLRKTAQITVSRYDDDINYENYNNDNGIVIIVMIEYN